MNRRGTFWILGLVAFATLACNLTSSAARPAEISKNEDLPNNGENTLNNVEPDEGLFDSMKVGETLKQCFYSFMTKDGDEYVAESSGNRYKNLDVYGLGPSEELSPADVENGVVWKGFMKLTFLVNEGSRWEDEDVYGRTYLLYKDGHIELWPNYPYKCSETNAFP